MATLKQIFSDYGPEYIERFGDRLPGEHRKVIDAIVHCRTQAYGATVWRCEDCGQNHLVYRCCGNRHCPNCQNHKTRQWLSRRIHQQLPVHHFMITFTVPEDIRAFIRSHPRRCYSAMFAASSQTLQKLVRDEKFIGADLAGFFGVLHTWGRTMPYHPHIHYIVPGGAICRSDGRWHPSRKDFFAPVRAMSKIFRAKFLDEMKKSGLASRICPDVWKQAWVVNCQAVGTGAQSIKYLAPYVFKVAISNSRIVKVENRMIFFKYKKTGSHRWRTKALEVMEFMRRFLQHVLPTGFMKVRYYGFMSPGSSISMQEVSACINRCEAAEATATEITIPVHPSPVCSVCGGNLIFCASIIPIRVKAQESG
jgi:hypothetical protein